MCSHYEAPGVHLLQKLYGVGEVDPYATDIWPGYTGVFIRKAPETDPHDEAAPVLEALPGTFGLLPHWAKDDKLARHTYNARSETVESKPSFRAAWKEAKHCIIPAAAIYEPDWRSGKSVPTRINRKDGELLSIAGLWASWRSPEGKSVHSFTMLTINADDHPFMRNYHKPGAEKRMVTILPQAQVHDWLNATASDSTDFLTQYPADQLEAEARPRR